MRLALPQAVRWTAAASLTALALLGPLPTPPAPPALTLDDTRAGTYAIDGGHSTVLFRIGHLGVSHFWGAFGDVSGEYVLDPEDAGACSISIAIDPASVDTRSAKRDAHAMSADFLDVETHDALTFVSTAVQETDEGRLEITGDLTLHGVTRSITAEAEVVGSDDTFQGYKTGVDASFTVQRTDFGMDSMLGALGDEIHLVISLEAALRQGG